MKRIDLIICAVRVKLGLKDKKDCDCCNFRYVCLTNIKVSKDDIKAYEPRYIPEFLCNVPNTAEGLTFYNQLKKYLNKDRYSLKRYGRAKNRAARGGNRSFIPLKNCDYFGVYLKTSSLIRFRKDREIIDSYTNIEET